MSINLLKRQNPHNLPREYVEVEYLESTGEQYIDSDIGTSDNTRITVDILFTSVKSWDSFLRFGSGTNIVYRSGATSNIYIPSIQAGSVQSTLLNQKYTLDIQLRVNDAKWKITGNNYITTTNYPATNFNTSNIQLARGMARFYSGVITVNNIQIRNFIPCYRKSDNKPGLYDTINSVFYTNANTSATTDFITGPEVGFDIQEVEPYILKKQLNIPAEYQEVEYLESTGEQYIDSGFIPNQDTRVVTEIKMPLQPTGSLAFFGQWTSYDTFRVFWRQASLAIAFQYGSADSFITDVGYTSDKLTIDFNKNNLYVNGVLKGSKDYQTISTSYSIYLFASIAKGSGSAPAEIQWLGKGPLIMYSCELYDNGTQVRNFIPCYRKSDNKPGLYDTINSQFYTNANTSASEDFRVGPDVNKYIIQPVDMNLLGGWKTAQLSQIPQWNQVMSNGNFAQGRAYPWYGVNGPAITVSDNALYFTPSKQYSGIQYDFNYVTGHKYYITATITPGSTNKIYLRGGLEVSTDGTTNRQTIDYVGVANQYYNKLYIRDYATSNFAQNKVENVMIVDLTAIFGKGNEPTKAQFEALFPNDYYAYKTATGNTNGSATINYQAIDTTNEIYQYKSSDISLGTGIIEV